MSPFSSLSGSFRLIFTPQAHSLIYCFDYVKQGIKLDLTDIQSFLLVQK